jgi:hypothetical protein
VLKGHRRLCKLAIFTPLFTSVHSDSVGLIACVIVASRCSDTGLNQLPKTTGGTRGTRSSELDSNVELQQAVIDRLVFDLSKLLLYW